jgi:hypothetical protein
LAAHAEHATLYVAVAGRPEFEDDPIYAGRTAGRRAVHVARRIRDQGRVRHKAIRPVKAVQQARSVAVRPRPQLKHRAASEPDPRIGARTVSTDRRRTVEVAGRILDQGGERLVAVARVAAETVQDRLTVARCRRGQLEHGSEVIAAAAARRPEQTTLWVFEQAAVGRLPVVPFSECVNHRLRVAARRRRQFEDVAATAGGTAELRRPEQIAARVLDQRRVGRLGVRKLAEVMENRLRIAAPGRRECEGDASAIRSAAGRRPVDNAAPVDDNTRERFRAVRSGEGMNHAFEVGAARARQLEDRPVPAPSTERRAVEIPHRIGDDRRLRRSAVGSVAEVIQNRLAQGRRRGRRCGEREGAQENASTERGRKMHAKSR